VVTLPAWLAALSLLASPVSFLVGGLAGASLYHWARTGKSPAQAITEGVGRLVRTVRRKPAEGEAQPPKTKLERQKL
jgi:hypothetical protein